MVSITANQVKTKGVSAFEPIVRESKTAMITIRGENRYVVMDLEKYNYLRECELVKKADCGSRIPVFGRLD